jgi:hypothetical protein
MMATLSRKPGANVKRREEWMRSERVILEMQARLAAPLGTEYPDDGLHRKEPDGGRTARAELSRLEAGGDAIVQGWAVGRATDFSWYVLAGDGTLTPHARPLTPYALNNWTKAEIAEAKANLGTDILHAPAENGGVR